MILLPAAASHIAADITARYPEEACGALGGEVDAATGSATIFIATACANVAPDPRSRYEILLEELLAIERRFHAAGLHWIGLYHSHPNGSAEPSLEDFRTASPQLRYLIVAIHAGDLRWSAWRFQANHHGAHSDPVTFL